MESALISGVAHDRSECKITVVGVPDTIGKAARVFSVLAQADINVDMIVQNTSVEANTTAISFTLPESDGTKALETLRRAQSEIGFTGLLFNDEIGKVSVIGVGMRTHPGVTATFFSALAQAGVNISMISTSEIRISVVVDAAHVDTAVRAAHTAFGLDADGEAVVYGGTGR